MHLKGAEATPGRVLAEMEEATDIEIHTHGLMSSSVSGTSLLVLSPETDGRYTLSEKDVRRLHLKGAPWVLLVACRAAALTPNRSVSVGLPAAFIEAGARAVLASNVDIPNSADSFFSAVRERVRRGEVPSVALRHEREQWLSKNPEAEWVNHVLLFE